jgi:hypothetical protein
MAIAAIAMAIRVCVWSHGSARARMVTGHAVAVIVIVIVIVAAAHGRWSMLIL